MKRASWRTAVLIVLGAAAVAGGGLFSLSVPGTPVPQSAQTLAVLLVGAGLGVWSGGMAVLLYLLAGGIGLPVFADGASGWAHLAGPTAGYFAGFLCAAMGVGWFVQRGFGHRPATALAVMLGGHVVILGMGWIRLAVLLGERGAFDAGVSPFIIGGVLKSVLAAAVTVGLMRVGGGVRTRQRVAP